MKQMNILVNPVTHQVSINTDYICYVPITIGTPLFLVPNTNIVRPTPSIKFIGISLTNLVKLKIIKNKVTLNGTICKPEIVKIVTHGSILVSLPKRWGKLPFLQPIYFDGRRLTLKCVSPKIGTILRQDKDNIYRIKIG